MATFDGQPKQINDLHALVSNSGVQGCNSMALGRLRYLATASPAFVQRHFPQGVDSASLARAPCLVFNHKDELQSRWLKRVSRKALAPPEHRLPASQAFLDGCLAGLGWGMNPLPMARAHLDAGRLVELVPGRGVDVPLYWQCSRLALPVLQVLSRCVLAAAKAGL